MQNTVCPKCGGYKKPWFAECWECTQIQNEKSTCDVCGITVLDNQHLCKIHFDELKSNRQLTNEPFAERPELGFKDKYSGKFYFNSMKVKSKSELLICYFLDANALNFQYEPAMLLTSQLRPDFVINDQKGHHIIIEHFGLDSPEYLNKRALKEKEYKTLCREHSDFFFISTEESDIYNLKDSLAKKLNQTPLRRPFWK